MSNLCNHTESKNASQHNQAKKAHRNGYATNSELSSFPMHLKYSRAQTPIKIWEKRQRTHPPTHHSASDMFFEQVPLIGGS